MSYGPASRMRYRLDAPGSIFLLLALLTSPSAAQNAAPSLPSLTADEIAHRVEVSNQLRNNALHRFEGSRTYTLHYHGFPSQSAEMVVTLSYQSPSTKNFKIVSQSGSKLIIDHVFKRMLESEREAAQEQSHNALTSSNYQFSLAGQQQLPEGNCYVLQVTPRTNNKFLYRGKIWVDAADFAVVKIEAEPAQNPSFFINRTEVHHRYKKVDSFWLPAENRTTSYLRFGGHADLTIEYQQYTITAADRLPPTATAAQNVAPGTSEVELKTSTSE